MLWFCEVPELHPALGKQFRGAGWWLEQREVVGTAWFAERQLRLEHSSAALEQGQHFKSYVLFLSASLQDGWRDGGVAACRSGV